MRKVDTILEDNSSNEQQQGFRRCRSKETAISNTFNYIEGFRKKEDHYLAVFLDIAATIDTIRLRHIKEQLLLKGVVENIVSWYHNYITERQLTLEANGYLC